MSPNRLRSVDIRIIVVIIIVVILTAANSILMTQLSRTLTILMITIDINVLVVLRL